MLWGSRSICPSGGPSSFRSDLPAPACAAWHMPSDICHMIIVDEVLIQKSPLVQGLLALLALPHANTNGLASTDQRKGPSKNKWRQMVVVTPYAVTILKREFCSCSKKHGFLEPCFLLHNENLAGNSFVPLYLPDALKILTYDFLEMISSRVSIFALVARDERARRRPAVVGLGADEPVVGQLLADVGHPAGDAAHREGGGEQIEGQPQAVEQRCAVELDVRIELAT